MISIITVCYNAERAIEGTIKSVLRQTYNDYEYIFVDGMSNDSTLEIIEKYVPKFEKKGITVKVVSERDNGIYDAMNKGIRMAEGTWINLLNAGDCYHNGQVLENLQVYLNKPQADIVIGEIVYIEGYLGRRYNHMTLENITQKMIFCHQAVFAARKLFQVKEFDVSYRYSADYDWLLYMYLKGYKYKCVDIVVAEYNSEGVSNQNREKTIAESLKIRINNGIQICEETNEAEDTINWKYKLYRKIAYNKKLARLYYKLCGKRRTDIYWISE